METQWGIGCTATIINPKDPNVLAKNLNASRSNVYKVNNPTAANQISIESEIQISPNPTNGRVNLAMSQFDNSSMKSIDVYNVYGEKIYEQTIRRDGNMPNGSQAANNGSFPDGLSLITFNLSLQPNGIYFLHIITSQGTAVKKIILNK